MSQSEQKRVGPTIIVYACDRCTEILAFLDACKMPYALIDVEEELDAGMHVADVNQGQFTMPAIQIGDDFYSLPTPAELAGRLGVDYAGD